MKVVCAWCGLEIKAGTGNDVSHGICSACEKEFNRQIKEAKEKKQARGFKLFWQFMTGRHWVVRQRDVLI